MNTSSFAPPAGPAADTDLPDPTLVDPAPAYRGTANYVLPFGQGYKKWSPLDPQAHAFGPQWLAGGTSYIVRRIDKPRSKATRVIHTCGTPDADWRIGNTWTIRHDQTNAFLGTYEVVGVVTYDADGDVARTAGADLNVKLSPATFK